MKRWFATEKKFIYLVQGEADRVKNYLCLADRKQADALFLTYDKPVGGGGSFCRNLPGPRAETGYWNWLGGGAVIAITFSVMTIFLS